MESSLVRLTELSKLVLCIACRGNKRQQTQQRQQTSANTAGGEMKARVSGLWSSTFRWDVQLAGSQPRERRKIFTPTLAVQDCDVAGRNSERSLPGECSSGRKGHGTERRQSSLFCIRRDVELARCGFSKDCEGCRVAASGDEVLRPHGKECRERIRTAVMCDDAGQPRLRTAEERLAPAASATKS